ncbi:hypothetical protein G9272_07205 [Streptomyces asoensis]|uniref:Uncharacterized protein n=1 Tax=Streptomyces asoensis TaxID=249586 RepID=A0A6M4WLJ8_9ACTN|nr:hypothetical protein G9272_07205 [Streptomyces asoensis]
MQDNPEIPSKVKDQAIVELDSGVPFLSDAQLKSAPEEAGTSKKETEAALDANETARINDLRAALAIVALTALLSLFFTTQIPNTQPGSAKP